MNAFLSPHAGVQPSQQNPSGETSSSAPSRPIPPIPSTSTGTNVQTQLHKTFHVLLGARSWSDFGLGQILVQDYRDEKFFGDLREEYIKLRGIFAFYFSVWRYSHCDFFEFEKTGDDEFIEPDDVVPLPPHTDKLYEYIPKPAENDRPVSKHEFKHRFYACSRRCVLPKAYHKCWRPNSRSTYVVDRIPKRLIYLERGGDTRGRLWGLRAREVRSLLGVVIYHLLLLIPAVVFWFLWLFAWDHGGDLQNASVPLFTAVALIGTFWACMIMIGVER
ncbi:hypothetical protein BKA61DRAFT_481825 [Leptodontidium sp. MPI-SDFR-AT-0119]|nr:hypothetical protein BKA61DRAFT_481825 [Leptodontidium sp. MPI-SDFR-AT-0119]